jgi:hypothetical protein
VERDIVDTVKERILQILELEESENPDWNVIGNLCDRTIDYIEEFDTEFKVDDNWYKFLEDWEIRKSDSKYGVGQRAQLREQLDYGDSALI